MLAYPAQSLGDVLFKITVAIWETERSGPARLDTPRRAALFLWEGSVVPAHRGLAWLGGVSGYTAQIRRRLPVKSGHKAGSASRIYRAKIGVLRVRVRKTARINTDKRRYISIF